MTIATVVQRLDHSAHQQQEEEGVVILAPRGQKETFEAPLTSANNSKNTTTMSSSSSSSPRRSSRTSSVEQRRRKRRSNATKKRRNKKVGRDLLVGMIAEEMANSWKEEESGIPGDDEDDGTIGGLSAADIFYAQINGEELNSGDQSLYRASLHSATSLHSGTSFHSIDSSSSVISLEPAEEGEEDCSSFAGGELLLQEANCNETPQSNLDLEFSLPVKTESSTPKSDQFVSTTDIDDDNDDADIGFVVPSSCRPLLTRSFSKATSVTTSATSSSFSSSGGESLTLDEIEDYVKSAMPEEIKNKIPQEAWKQIFGTSQADKTRMPIGFVVEEDDKEEEVAAEATATTNDTTTFIVGNDDDNDDAASVISEITEYSSFVPSPLPTPSKQQVSRTPSFESSNDSLARMSQVFPGEVNIANDTNEEEQEEFLCPTLPPSSSDSMFGGASVNTNDMDDFWGIPDEYWPSPILPPPLADASTTRSRERGSSKASSESVSSSTSRHTTKTTRSAKSRATTASTSTVSTNSSSRRSNTTKIKFGMVHVRYYERILDVNPAVSGGVAIGIGWKYRRGGKISVHEWENQRIGKRRSRPNDYIVPKKYREKIVRDLGYTQKDIATATRIILKVKQNRKVTVQNLPNQHMEEAVENAARKVKGLLSLGKKKGLVSSSSYLEKTTATRN